MVKGTTNVFDALSVNHEAFAYVHDKTLGKINEAYDANVYKLTKSRRKSKHVRISSCCYCLFFVSRAYHLFTFAAFFLYSFSSVFYCVFSKILPFQAFGSSFFFWNQKHSQSTPIPFCCCKAQSKHCLYLDMFKASSKIHLKWMALSMHANLELMQKRETNTIRYAYRCFFCTATEWNEGDENGVADRQSDKTSIYHRAECFYMQICP